MSTLSAMMVDTHSMYIGVLASVLMHTVLSAPMNQGEVLASEDMMGTVARAKRADEAIYFGNQQNKARVIAKKSGKDQPQTGSSRDSGAEVMAHPEVPVSAGLEHRVEAALEKDKDGQKMTDALASAMQSAVEQVVNSHTDSNDVITHGNDVITHDDTATTTESDNAGHGNDNITKDLNEKAAMVGDVHSSSQIGAGDANEIGSVPSIHEASGKLDSDDLIGEMNSKDDSGVKYNEGNPNRVENKSDIEESDMTDVTSPADRVPADASESPGAASGGMLLRAIQQGVMQLQDQDPVQWTNDVYTRLNEHPTPLLYPSIRRGPVWKGDEVWSRVYGRRRRSSALKIHGRRRIKRDLIEDEFGVPYGTYTDYSPSQYGSDDTSAFYPEDDPTTYSDIRDIKEKSSESESNEGPDNEDIEDMYRLFLLYLERKAEEERAEEEKLAQALRRYVASQRAKLQLEEAILSSENDYSTEPYSMGNPYGVEYHADSSMYPRTRRTYLSPPGSIHWGSFVPEKRDYFLADKSDYADALERLQGLAVALSEANVQDQYDQYQDLLEELYKKR